MASLVSLLVEAVFSLLSLYAGRSSLTASISKGGNTLMHSILKTASLSIGSYRSYVVGKATANPHSEVLRATFCLLSNSVLSPECRGILKKVSNDEHVEMCTVPHSDGT